MFRIPALAVQKILQEDNILQQASVTSKYLKNKLRNSLIDHPNIGEIRSIGLINAIELVKDKNTKERFDGKLRVGYEVYKEALKNGLILRPLGNVLYFNPPLNINNNEIDKAINICRDSIFKTLDR